MGYTHYFTPVLDKKHFDTVVDDIKVIEKATKLFDSSGETLGVDYRKESFAFNGNASKGEEHETFCLGVGGEWDFCKTARKPYDVAVVVSLLCLKYHSPTSDISSDGDSEDWMEGYQLFNVLFPKILITFFNMHISLVCCMCTYTCTGKIIYRLSRGYY